MLLHKTPNQPKFRCDRLINVGDILGQKFLLLEKSGPNYAKYFRTMLLTKTLNHAKFCGDRLKNA